MSDRQQGNSERREVRNQYRSEGRHQPRFIRSYDERRYEDRAYHGRTPRLLSYRDRRDRRNDFPRGSRDEPHRGSREELHRGSRSYRPGYERRGRRPEREKIPPTEVMDSQLKRYMAGEKIEIAQKRKY